MYQHRALTISGATAFTKASHPQDEIFAIAFNEYVTPVLPASSPFTSDGSMLRVALERNVNSRGRTAFMTRSLVAWTISLEACGNVKSSCCSVTVATTPAARQRTKRCTRRKRRTR